MAAKKMGRQNWAELGARVRLSQLDAERAAILKAFPHLRRGPLPDLAVAARPRRKISAAARKAMSAGMKKFWARRKALDKKPKSRRTEAVASEAQS